jgi:deoxyribonuclease-4
MNKLLFGTAGVPLSAINRTTIDGINRVKELGLGSMELEFVRGVRMSPQMAEEVREVAKKKEVVLTAHGPYYINLNSKDHAITQASIKRILETARIANICGAYSITFHAAYYVGMEKEKVYDVVKGHLRGIVKTLQNEGVKLWIRPETTGKGTQFGDIDELIKLSQEVEQVLPCVDFSHLHARSNGKFNTYNEFSSVLEKLEKGLGRKSVENMHAHLSGIAYSEKGERNHLVLKDSDMNYKELVRAFRNHNCSGVIISESPNLESDALMVKKEYEKEMAI